VWRVSLKATVRDTAFCRQMKLNAQPQGKTSRNFVKCQMVRYILTAYPSQQSVLQVCLTLYFERSAVLSHTKPRLRQTKKTRDVQIMRQSTLVPLVLLALSACAPGSGLSEAPESVAQLAAPNQNLQAVVLKEEDNCYWYQHVGPVETTLLPLRSKRGGHICAPDQTKT